MAEQKNRTNRRSSKKAEPEKVTGTVKIVRAYEFEDGTISFDMDFNQISFYRCMIRKGKNGDFIAFPSYKGGDGNYYHYYYINFDESTAEKVIDAVYAKLDTEDE